MICLATELMMLIFKHTTVTKSDRDCSTLLSLCRVSRRFRLIAQPLLYGDIDCTSESSFQLLRTLLVRTDLLNLVRHVRLEDRLPTTTRQPQISAKLANLLSEFILGAGLEVDTWLPAVATGSSSVFFALLLACLLPTTRSATVVVNDRRKPKWLWAVLATPRIQNSTANLSCFHYAERRYLSDGRFDRESLLPCYKYKHDIQSFEHLLKFRVKDLSIKLLGLDYLNWSDDGRLCTTLSSLTLRNQTPDVLQKFLEICPGITALSYIYACDLDPGRIKLGHLRDALEPAADRLQELRVRTILSMPVRRHYDNCAHYSSRDMVGRFGSIKSFTSLRSLEIPLVLLCGNIPGHGLSLHDILPDHLERLGLRDELLDMDDSVWDLDDCLNLVRDFFAIRKEQRISHLDFVIFEGHLYGFFEELEQEEEMAMVCESAGVKLGIVIDEEFGDVTQSPRWIGNDCAWVGSAGRHVEIWDEP